MKIKKSILNKFKIIMIFAILNLTIINNTKTITLKEHIACLSLGSILLIAGLHLLKHEHCTNEICQREDRTKKAVGSLLILSAICIPGSAYYSLYK